MKSTNDTGAIKVDIEYMLEEMQKSLDHWDAMARHGIATLEGRYAEGRADAYRFLLDYIKRNGYAKLDG